MIALLARRVGHGILVLFVVSLLAFLLSTVVGDPVASILGLSATPEDRIELASRLGLDRPWFVRYVDYIWNAVHFRFGMSYSAQRPVADLLVERIPATIELASVALVISLGVGIPLGLAAAVNRGKWWATVLMSSSVIGLSLPTFVVGILLIFVFSVQLGWLPSFGRGETVAIGWWTTGLLTKSGLLALIMPATALAISQIALIARLVRAEMLDVLRADYIRFARARGISQRSIQFSHALRNTLIPVITVSGIQLGFLVAFAIVAEAVFQWPGLGLLFITALGSTDIPVISAFLLLAAAFFVAINFIVDVLYVVVDPRLRAGTAGAGASL